MRDIYIVTADYGYDGFNNIKAFNEEPKAYEFCEELKKYKESMPKYEEEWGEEYDKKIEGKLKKWREKHPCFDHAHAEGYNVVTLNLV